MQAVVKESKKPDLLIKKSSSHASCYNRNEGIHLAGHLTHTITSPHVEPKPTNINAVVSMIVGFTSFFALIFPYFGRAAIAIGFIALDEIRKNENTESGKGMAIGGIIPAFSQSFC